jgi:hypothetical protein
MKYEYIQTVYFNKEITDRPLDDYDDRLGRFCVIELKKVDYPKGRNAKVYEMLSCLMKLLGYPDTIDPEKVEGSLEINHCWVYEDDDMISIQHKYWNGHEMKVFCDLMAALATYLHFEMKYVPTDEIGKLSRR